MIQKEKVEINFGQNNSLYRDLFYRLKEDNSVKGVHSCREQSFTSPKMEKFCYSTGAIRTIDRVFVKFQKELGLKVTTAKAAIVESVSWMKQQGYIKT